MNTTETNKIVDCEALTQEVLAVMSANGYSCKNEFYIYRSLTGFCRERHEGKYSHEVGAAFLSEKLGVIKSTEHQHVYQNAILRLNQVLLGNIHWKPDPVLKPYPHSCFDEIVSGYEEYLNKTKKTRNDIRGHVRLAAFFLVVAEQQGIDRMEDLTPSIIHIAFAKAGDKEGFRKIKPFLRYAFCYGLTSRDLREFVPTVPRHKPIPSVYTPEEINAVFESVDRRSELGKRDYCILLLAARYGIRTSDIARALKWSDYDEAKEKLNIARQIVRRRGVDLKEHETVIEYTKGEDDCDREEMIYGRAKDILTRLIQSRF